MQPGQLDHWSDYWTAGRLTSLHYDFVAGHQGEITVFWAARFRDAPEGESTVDACTRNGPMAVFKAAHSAARGRCVELVAIDSAAMASGHPDVVGPIAQIEFVGISSVESAEFGWQESGLWEDRIVSRTRPE